MSSLFLLFYMAVLDRVEKRGEVLRERELGEGASSGLNMTVVLFSRRNVVRESDHRIISRIKAKKL